MQTDRGVAILTSVFLPDDDRMTFSGADRYMVSLYRLLDELGFNPRVWQIGETAREYAGIRLEHLPNSAGDYGMLPELNLQFYEKTLQYDRAIYFAPFLVFPRVKPRSVAISHGVAWDYPSHPFTSISGPVKQEWMRRMHYSVAAPDLFVSVDTNTLNWIRATWPGYENKQVYIPNFVDMDIFRPGDTPHDRLVVLYPRRLTWIRGQDDVKVVAERLTRRYDFIEFHFVGRGATDEEEENMRRWSAENPRCLYYWVSMDEMADVYRKADIVLIPTRAAEGTSLSCLEAMACGKAVIAGWVGGLSDLVIDQYNGVLTGVTPDALEDAIEDLIWHPEKRERLAAKALETAAMFSLSNWKVRWVKALQRIWGDWFK